MAATDLGADLARVSMAVDWGDAWTNMIQPFWALPALAIKLDTKLVTMDKKLMKAFPTRAVALAAG